MLKKYYHKYPVLSKAAAAIDQNNKKIRRRIMWGHRLELIETKKLDIIT
jgi:hypothetical protein